MSECELIRKFLSFRKALESYDYGVEVLPNGFYIRNPKGSFIADCQTVDGVVAAYQMLEWAENKK